MIVLKSSGGSWGLPSLVLACCFAACAPNGVAPSALDSAIESVASEMKIPGLATAVVRDGRVLYLRGHGYQSLESGRPVDGRSLFHLASVSKLMTATAIMRLVEGGELRLDDTLGEKLNNATPADARWSGITLRQLMSHTSGIGDESEFGWDDPQVHDEALEEYVAMAARDELTSDPGTQFGYSNVGYSVLGHIAARTTERHFEDMMEEFVLAPLGMVHSSFRLSSVASSSSLTAPHVLGENYKVSISQVRPYSRQHAPSSTLYSSLEEISRWLSALTSEAVLRETGLLDSRSLNAMWSAAPGTDGQAGLGWHLGDHRGERMVFHGGLDLGYSSFLAVLRDKRLGVVVLANYDRAPAREIAFAALDWALEIPLEPIHVAPDYLIDQLLYQSLGSSGLSATADRFRALHAEREFDFGQVRRLLTLARNLKQEGRVEEAALLYRLSLEIYPQLGFLHELEASALIELGDLEAARLSLERALDINSSSSRANDLMDRINVREKS